MSVFPLPGDHTSRAWLATGLFMFAFLFAIAPATLIDPRMIDGVSVWSKPLKFCLALGVHFITLALLVQLLTPKTRAGIVMRGAVWASVAAGLFEIVYIAVQAARARRSHFNFETVFEANMYTAMGLGALLLVLAPLALGVLLALQRDGDRSALRRGAVIGLIAAPIATIVFAGFMSSTGSHFVGAPNASDAGGLPLFGWSTREADLRPAHFVATHMMQSLPLVGYAADRLAPRMAGGLVVLAGLAQAALAAALFAVALSGAPPLGFLN